MAVTGKGHARMPPQMVAFVFSAAAGAGALLCLTAGMLRWALGLFVIAVATGIAARVWSRREPAPMPHWMRWILFLPRTFQSSDRLKAILRLEPGQRVLEVGPGVGIHALPVATALVPGGVLAVVDVQRPMVADLMQRAARTAIRNLQPQVGDAAHLPYRSASFHAAYLISVLGEIGDESAALCELLRVLKPSGRLVIGEIVVDPDFVSLPALRARLSLAGFEFESSRGPCFAYLASFRVGDARRHE